jgi:hypothetical protein
MVVMALRQSANCAHVLGFVLRVGSDGFLEQ